MSQLYTLVPLAQGPFSGLDPVTRLTFGVIWDRFKVSWKNVTNCTEKESRWADYDHDGLVFCLFSQAELAGAVGVTDRTVRSCLEKLRAAGVIDYRKATFKGACRYYVLDDTIEYLRADLNRK